MKSVLQGGWLLTVAFGNVIVLIVAEGAGLEQVLHLSQNVYVHVKISLPEHCENQQ